MRGLRAWLVRLAATFGRRRDVDAELESHLQLHVDDGVRAGLPEAEARRLALARLGGAASIREAYHDQSGVPALRIAADAARHGWRSLLRHPAFSAAIIGILAIGVGSTAALVGVIDGLLFRPPAHVHDPDRLVRVVSARNYPQYEELGRNSRALDVAAFTKRSLTLGQGETARPIETQCVTAAYFTVFGAAPVSGRAFTSADEAPGAPPTVVLSDGLWRREFAGEDAAIGRTVLVGGRPHTVIGIAPPGFRGIELGTVDAWTLLPIVPELCSFTGRNQLTTTNGSWLTTVGRLRPGVELAQAETETRTVAAGLSGARTSDRELVPLLESRRNSASRDARLAAWLGAGAILMLLIGCANVAGLLSVRAIERRREIAVRLQLGASRGRVFLQLLAENLALAAACAVVAWVVAGWIGVTLRTFFPSIQHDAWLDSRAIAVVGAFAVAAGLLAGVLPALQTSRGRVTALWRSGHAVSEARSRTRNALLVVQVALGLVLVVGAGVFARSVQAAKAGLGYDLDRVVVATVDLERAGIRRQTEQRRLFEEMLERVRRLPGVEAAAMSTSSPLGSAQSQMVMPGPPPGGPGSAATLRRLLGTVSPEYFRTMGTRIVEGRTFTEADAIDPVRVAVVDAGLAREIWPGERVVGECRSFVIGQACVQIVGISEPRRFMTLQQTDGEIFYSLGQLSTSVPQAIVIRPSGPVVDAVPAIAAAIRSAAPDLPFVNVRTLDDLANVQARSWRLGAMLFGLFGTIAVLLAAVGLYASLAFAIRQRTAEIGVRMSLGATPREIAAMVLQQATVLVAVGWVLGLVAAVVFVRSIEALLFGVAPLDPIAFAAGSLAIGAAGLLGCLLPAWRAARVDPVIALRTE